MRLSDYEPVVLEIIERRKGIDTHAMVPNEVRLNGRKLLTSADEPVVVHGISTSGEDLLRVTVTLIARKVVFDAEQIEPDDD